jgi:hypothetical protein
MNNAFTISGSSTSYTILNGYDFSDNALATGEILYADMGFYQDFGYGGSYDDICTAMTSFFSQYGIAVNFPPNDYFVGNIVDDSIDAQKIFSCSNKLVSRGNEWNDPIAVVFEGTEFTNMREFINPTDDTDNLATEEINAYGNTTGNIVNSGHVAIQGNRIYYASLSRSGIYSMNTDGSDRYKLNDDVALYINVVGDRIYYSNSGDGNFYSINTDGTDKQKLSSERASYVNVVGDRIYYSGDGGSLYCMNTDGTNERKLHDRGDNINVVDDKIYYTSDGGIYSMNTDGTDRRKVNDDEPRYINVVDDKIYYAISSFASDDGIYSINTDGTNRQKLSDDNAWHINVAGDRIYYIDIGNMSDAKIYSIKTDGTDKLKLSDESINIAFNYINIVDGRVYYGGDNGLCSIKTDGTDKRVEQ